ncbi:MAG: mechanosensitive ion channel family protein [Ruminiclostridium sp.]
MLIRLLANEFDQVAESINGLNKFIIDVWNGFLAKLPTIIFAIVILIVGMLLSKLTVKLMSKALDRSRLDLTVNRFLKSMVNIALYVLLITVVLTVLGVPTTSIITVIGTAGVAIGLALQNSLSNLAGGFLILFSKPFAVGSYIKSNGEEGTVDSINILYTRLITVDNKVVYIPNGMAANAVCINYNELPLRRIDQIISISYSEDYDRTKTAILTALSKEPKIITEGENAPFVALSAQSASSIDITVRVWCKSADYWDVYFSAAKLIREQFINDNIDVPYNQLDVHIRND